MEFFSTRSTLFNLLLFQKSHVHTPCVRDLFRESKWVLEEKKRHLPVAPCFGTWRLSLCPFWQSPRSRRLALHCTQFCLSFLPGSEIQIFWYSMQKYLMQVRTVKLAFRGEIIEEALFTLNTGDTLTHSILATTIVVGKNMLWMPSDDYSCRAFRYIRSSIFYMFPVFDHFIGHNLYPVNW